MNTNLCFICDEKIKDICEVGYFKYNPLTGNFKVCFFCCRACLEESLGITIEHPSLTCRLCGNVVSLANDTGPIIIKLVRNANYQRICRPCWHKHGISLED